MPMPSYRVPSSIGLRLVVLCYLSASGFGKDINSLFAWQASSSSSHSKHDLDGKRDGSKGIAVDKKPDANAAVNICLMLAFFERKTA